MLLANNQYTFCVILCLLKFLKHCNKHDLGAEPNIQRVKHNREQEYLFQPNPVTQEPIL